MSRQIGILVAFCLLAGVSHAQEAAPSDGIEDFTLNALDGSTFHLASEVGDGPMLINFWATWCAPCLVEMKALSKMYKKLDGTGVRMVAISIDDPGTLSKVKSMVKTRRYPFEILLDPNSEVMNRYGGDTPPFTVLLDQEGTITYRRRGYRKGDEAGLEEKIRALLEAPEKSEGR